MHLPPGGRRSHDGCILQLTLQSVFITNKVVSSIPVRDEVYSIQHYVIKFVSDLSGRWFSPCNPVSSNNKIDLHDITAILLKVTLNTINLNHLPSDLRNV